MEIDRVVLLSRNIIWEQLLGPLTYHIPDDIIIENKDRFNDRMYSKILPWRQVNSSSRILLTMDPNRVMRIIFDVGTPMLQSYIRKVIPLLPKEFRMEVLIAYEKWFGSGSGDVTANNSVNKNLLLDLLRTS